MTPSDVRVVELGITNKCTLRCPHCDSIKLGLPNQQAVNLDLAPLLNFLDSLPSLETVLLEGAYSDQLMYPDLLDVVKYCKDRRLNIKFCTHGSARAVAWWEQLGSMLVSTDVVRFAIDGSTQQLHSTYRVNSQLHTVLRNHAVLKQHSAVLTSLQHIVFEYNKHDTENVVQLATREKFDRCEIIQCGNVTTTPELQRAGIVPLRELLSHYTIHNKVISTARQHTEYVCDSIIRSEIYINHRGEITLCADHDNGIIKPNIYTSSTSELLSALPLHTNKRICFRGCNKMSYNIGNRFPTIVHSSNGAQPVKFHTRDLT